MSVKNSVARSVAGQIRKVALGVNTGGASGRSSAIHKGVGLNQNSGGWNAHGTGAKLGGLVRPAGPVLLPKPSMPLPSPKLSPKPSVAPTVPSVVGGEMLKVPKMTPNGYRLVPVAASSLTPAALAAARKNPYNQKATAPVAPGAPGAPDAAAPNGLDYTGLPSYMNGMRDMNDQYGAQEDDLNQQLADNPRLYSNAVADDHLAAQRDASASANQMSQMGLLRSGARETADADRVKLYSDHMNEIEGQYGATATAKLQAALDHLHGQQSRDQEGLESSAKDEWAQTHPSNPIGAPVVTPLPKPVLNKPGVTPLPKPLLKPKPVAPLKPVPKFGVTPKPGPVLLPKPTFKPGPSRGRF